MQVVIQYFKSSIAEFNNITWPTRKQAVRISVVVLAFMVASAALLGVLDQLLSMGYKALLTLKI